MGRRHAESERWLGDFHRTIISAPLIGVDRYNYSILFENGIPGMVSLRDGCYGACDILGFLVVGFDHDPDPSVRALDQ